jgi:hypothetical protein
MTDTLARSDREAKEAAERRAQLAEARVREIEERLDLALAAITEARAEAERLRDARALALEESAALCDRESDAYLREAEGASVEVACSCRRIALTIRRIAAAIRARAALVSPSPRPAENEGNEAKENA